MLHAVSGRMGRETRWVLVSVSESTVVLARVQSNERINTRLGAVLAAIDSKEEVER